MQANGRDILTLLYQLTVRAIALWYWPLKLVPWILLLVWLVMSYEQIWGS